MATKTTETHLNEGLSSVEAYLASLVTSDVQTLYDASQHILSSGGKRVRPQLLLLAYMAAGGQDVEKAVPLATAVETLHTATLVHDDINDHSDTRRGKVSVPSRWGRTFALLTGDYLFAKVYELMAPYGSPYNEIMSNASVRLVEGETLQALAAKAGEMDRETYKKVISRKTASLFEAAAQMGAHLGGASEAEIEALADYGYNLGLTFQIVDDILDIVGDPEKLGKPVGIDMMQNRGVMMVQNGGAAVAEAESRATSTRSVQAVLEDDPVQRMLHDLRESGAVEIARMQAREVANRARAALDHLPDSEAREMLYDLVDLVMERDK
jgi:octaprenyl-diphosphate synthase